MILKALALLLSLLSVYADESGGCEVLVATDISLEEEGVAPHEADMMGTVFTPMGASTNIDVYWCEDVNTEHDDDDDRTLIVFSASAGLEVVGDPDQRAGKDIFTMFATDLAEEGYVVAIVEKPIPIMGISAVIPLDFLRVIQYIESGQSPVGDVELSAVAVGGHGFGGAMTGFLLTQLCPGTFCPPLPWPMGPPGPPTGDQPEPYEFNEDDLETFSLIKAAFWYGGTVFRSVFIPGQEPVFIHDPTMTGDSGVPILMVYGTGEENILGPDERALASFEQFETEKALVVIEDLDHDGPTDLPVAVAENVIPTTLAREEAADRVSETVLVWLDFILGDPEEDNFCVELETQLEGESYVDTCRYEDVDEPSESSDGSVADQPADSMAVLRGRNNAVLILAHLISLLFLA